MTSKSLAVVSDTQKCVEVTQDIPPVSLKIVAHINTKPIKELKW